MLFFDRNRSLTCVKIRASTTRPSTDGRAPGSPDRSRLTQPLPASPIERSSMSSENSPELAGCLPASALVWGVLVDIAGPLDVLVGGGGCQTLVTTASGRDQLDDLRSAGLLLGDLGGHPTQVEGADAVGDLHDVVHVVGDQHHAEALV